MHLVSPNALGFRTIGYNGAFRWVDFGYPESGSMEDDFSSPNGSRFRTNRYHWSFRVVSVDYQRYAKTAQLQFGYKVATFQLPSQAHADCLNT
jgi:hypothetical protein